MLHVVMFRERGYDYQMTGYFQSNLRGRSQEIQVALTTIPSPERALDQYLISPPPRVKIR